MKAPIALIFGVTGILMLGIAAVFGEFWVGVGGLGFLVAALMLIGSDSN